MGTGLGSTAAIGFCLVLGFTMVEPALISKVKSCAFLPILPSSGWSLFLCSAEMGAGMMEAVP